MKDNKFYICNNVFEFDRTGMLNLFPKNSIGAELGVEAGKFSLEILNVIEPQKLFLIDSWIDVMTGEFKNENEVLRQESNYNMLIEKYYSDEKIKIIRKNLNDAANDIKDQSLDWIYLDASHNYESVKNDLQVWDKKVKNQGIISGHDWTPYPLTKKGVQFGVNRAVFEFVEENNYQFLGVTNESKFKSFVLIKTL